MVSGPNVASFSWKKPKLKHDKGDQLKPGLSRGPNDLSYNATILNIVLELDADYNNYLPVEQDEKPLQPC